jgi:aspartate/methionine/tyrosine aminotransferase
MQFNQNVIDTEFPPVTEAAGWVAGRTFPDDFPLIDVSQAVPGYPTAPDILQHLTNIITQPPVSKYGHALGMTALREEYATQLQSLEVTTDNVAITAGCNQAFYVAAAALCKPGDSMLLPVPWYFNHKMSLDMLGVETVPLPCDPANQLLPDVETTRQLINKNTRGIVLISPNNPTGQVYPPETIDAFYNLARETGIPLLLDETYCDFRETADTKPHSVFEDPEWSNHAIHLYSFSKAYALAGYRVGALVASPQVLNEVTKVLDCVSICAPQISQHAALYGLQHAAEWKEQKRQLMYERAGAFQTALQEHNHGYNIAAIGAYFAYLQHPFDADSRTVAKHLADHANLLSLPGEMFGPGQQQFLRVAFANVASEKMPEIARRLAEFTV